MRKVLLRRVQKHGRDCLEIADDLMEVHKAYAEMLLRRYKNDPRSNFITGRDKTEKRHWIVGQRLFQSFLNEWRIPYIHDEPAFKFVGERLAPDFIIPNFGTVEIKTRHWKTDTMIIKRVLWDKCVEEDDIPDYVIALKLYPNENLAEIGGYEYGSEINKLPNAPGICIHSPCYSKPYNGLHPFSELDSALKSCSLREDLRPHPKQRTLMRKMKSGKSEI